MCIRDRGTSANVRLNGGSAGVPANWNTRVLRVVVSSANYNLFSTVINLANAGQAETPIDFNNLVINSGYNATAALSGTRTPTVFNDTSTGATPNKLLVTVGATQLGDASTNRALQDVRGTTPYNDVVAINSLTTDYISGVGITGTQIDVRYVKMSTTDLDQFFTAVTDANNSPGISQQGDGDVFTTQSTAMVTIDGSTNPATIAVQYRDAPTGISGDSFSAGLTNQNNALSTAINNAVEPLY